jgi:hypothetical protein
MQVGAATFSAALLALGVLLALLWIVRRIQRTTRTVPEAPGLWEGRDYRCPQCGTPMAQGWVMLGRGAIWAARGGRRPGIFAHIGASLENTISLSLPPAANMAWRCPTCRLLLVDHDKLVKDA